MGAGRATVWVRDGWIWCRTPYNKAFVKALKEGIPTSARKWDPDEKVWKVDPSYDAELFAIIEPFYGEPTVIEEKQEVVVSGAAGDDPYGALLRLAPTPVLKKCYRLIAAALHPDAGGNGTDMVQVNKAWVSIKQDRGL